MTTRGEAESPIQRALALLPIPLVSALSEQQVRGHVCVWCGAALTTGKVVDLGQRRLRRLDGHVTMFPRACRRCTANQAEAAVRDHAGECEQCVDNPEVCKDGTALRELMREYRRPESYPSATMSTAYSRLTEHSFACSECTPSSSCAKGDRLYAKYKAEERAARDTGKAGT